MIKYKCDHCGAVIEQLYQASVKYKISVKYKKPEDKDYHLMHGALCEKCFDELIEFCSKAEEKAE